MRESERRRLARLSGFFSQLVYAIACAAGGAIALAGYQSGDGARFIGGGLICGFAARLLYRSVVRWNGVKSQYK